MKAALIRIVLASAVMVAAAGAGYGASSGSQTVTVAAGSRIDVTVPASASIASTDPGACGTVPTTVNVKSNRPWNLQIRSEPVTYPNGKAKDGSGTELVNPLQYKGGDVLVFTDITSTYANLFLTNQPKTGNRDVTVDYQQCIDWQDSPGTYTIVVEYLGVQP
ncbi:MAG: hypothetical protein QN173_09655 [Armatimonadota bacterium]|nr:hypothetical protein [Armatimonadota bacterium]MDR7401534.1 hypothetical protein [Armatimonadota bacterium]MDR7403276.1 hypothetical protein [Armatimonadota bacterium]MDR7437654.1 hypothetical protein [Armatimonadota bacterium]MDR7471658.1 hypothetical protein [Armatimonadota bacterium]